MTDTDFAAKLAAFAAAFEAAQRARLAVSCPNLDLEGGHYSVKVVPGPVYTKVDFGGSGKYMVENATGTIYGIKGYGRVHKGHWYGTLDTIAEWDWSGYGAVRSA